MNPPDAAAIAEAVSDLQGGASIERRILAYETLRVHYRSLPPDRQRLVVVAEAAIVRDLGTGGPVRIGGFIYSNRDGNIHRGMG